MTATLVLVVMAAILSFVAIPALGTAQWPIRSPALGILAWQTTSISIYSSLVLAGLTLAVPELPVGEGLAEFFHACTAALEAHYSTPGGVLLSVLGGVVALGLLTRLGLVASRVALRSRRERAHQLDLLAIVCRPHASPDVVVVDHEVAAVYCLPGRRRRIVVTQAAMSALSPSQMHQVLAHERAHLRSRHHLALFLAEALATTFGQRFGLAAARDRITELAEMHADDAADASLRAELATALVVLAGGSRPAGALGASGACALTRVQRLVAPAAPISSRQRRVVIILAGALLLTPVLIALAPATAATMLDYCPIFLD